MSICLVMGVESIARENYTTKVAIQAVEKSYVDDAST